MQPENRETKKPGKLPYTIMAILAALVSLYPLAYAFFDPRFGLLSTKAEWLLNNRLWNLAFYTHIAFGGLSLLIGWLQFKPAIRRQRIYLHRFIGKTYIISVVLSAIAGLYIAHFATGGFISALGFISLGVIWLFTTLLAYKRIRQGKVVAHRIWMTYSYAACFAAVTLRIWLPLLIAGFGDFIPAYQTVAWLCWIPNLMLAAWLHRRILKNPTL